MRLESITQCSARSLEVWRPVHEASKRAKCEAQRAYSHTPHGNMHIQNITCACTCTCSCSFATCKRACSHRPDGVRSIRIMLHGGPPPLERSRLRSPTGLPHGFRRIPAHHQRLYRRGGFACGIAVRTARLPTRHKTHACIRGGNMVSRGALAHIYNRARYPASRRMATSWVSWLSVLYYRA